MQKVRKSNLELLRILAMFGIIMYHGYYYSQISSSISNIAISLNEVIIQFLSVFGHVGNAVFALLSGYFLISNNKVKFNKLLKIILQVLFYSIIFLIIFKVWNLAIISKSEILKSLFPITFENYWYATFYVLLYVASPILNKLLNSVSKKEFKIMLLVMFILWGIKDSLFFGTKFTYYLFIYCVGAYIKIYEKDLSISKKKSLYFLIFSLIVTFIMIVICDLLGMKYSIFYNKGIKYIIFGHSLFSFSIALFAFLFFKTLNLNNRVINSISGTVFGIYLLHENRFFNNIWLDKISIMNHYFSPFFIIYFILICSIMFIIFRNN